MTTHQAQRVLSDADLASFANDHYVALDDCIPPRLAARITHNALATRGIDPGDQATWPKTGLVFLSSLKPSAMIVDLRDLAPKAWAAACELIGGEERAAGPVTLGDDLIVNFDLGADQPWQAPSAAGGAWHIDGDFNHFLESPEIGLLGIVLFTDVVERGGATWIACDSIAPAARALHDHPRGLSAFALRSDFEFHRGCTRFMPLTGPAGRVYLMHPLMLHSVAWNPLRRVRAIRNFAVPLAEPMRFDAAERPLSPVEAATLHALGDGPVTIPAGPPELRGPTDHDTGSLLPPAPRVAPMPNTIDSAGLALLERSTF